MTIASMRVAILEPFSQGHHASYVRWILEGFQRRGWTSVLVTTQAALQHPLLRSIDSETRRSVEFRILEPRSEWAGSSNNRWALLWRELTFLRAFERAVVELRRSVGIDAVLLPYVDYCFHALAFRRAPFGGLPWAGITMRLGGSSRTPDAQSARPWKWKLALRLLRQRNLVTLFSISPSTMYLLRESPARLGMQKLLYLPDPAEQRAFANRDDARAIRNIDPQAVVILVFGTIDERKGVDALVDCVASAPELDKLHVVIAGKQSPSMKARMGGESFEHLRQRGRLTELDEYLDDEQQAAVFAMADAVWVAYVNHAYMSGVLVLAGRSGLPVIASDFGEVGTVVREERTGIVVNTDDPAQVRRALREMCDPAVRKDYAANATRAFAGHTIENFTATLSTAMETGIGSVALNPR